jgi:hypothetical protein
LVPLTKSLPEPFYKPLHLQTVQVKDGFNVLVSDIVQQDGKQQTRMTRPGINQPPIHHKKYRSLDALSSRHRAMDSL